MRLSAALIATSLLAGPASAQSPQVPPRAEDHLEPSASILGDGGFMANYDLMLRDVLHQAYGRDVVLRMVAKPSFIPEFAVGLRGGKIVGKGDVTVVIPGAPYHIFGLAPAASVWTYESISSLKNGAIQVVGDNQKQLQNKEIARLQSTVPENHRDLKVAQCQADISDVLGARIVEVWHKMLMRTRYSQQNTNGFDGAIYDFSMFVRGQGDASGKAWSPDRNSSIGTLVALADEMYGVCTKKNDASMDQVEKLTAELEHRLN